MQVKGTIDFFLVFSYYIAMTHKSQKDTGKKTFAMVLIVSILWAFYSSLDHKKRGVHNTYISKFESEVSEEKLRKYRGKIDLNSYKSVDPKNILYYCFDQYERNYPIIQECKRLGLVISDDLIKESIVGKPIFFDENYDYSEHKFKECLSEWGISESDYYDLIREDLLIKQYYFFLRNSYILSQRIVDRYKKQYSKILLLKFGKINHDKVVKKFSNIVVSDEDLSIFFEANKDMFSLFNRADYELYELKNTDQNRTLLNFYIKNKMKDIILRNFEHKLVNLYETGKQDLIYTVDHTLSYEKESDVYKIFYNIDNDKDYLLIIKKPAEYVERSYSEIPIEELKTKYLFVKAKSEVNESFIDDWETKEISAQDYFVPGIPSKFIKQMFTAKVKTQKVFQDEKSTYFITVESVNQNDAITIDEDELKKKMDDILIESVSEYLYQKCLNEKKD